MVLNRMARVAVTVALVLLLGEVGAHAQKGAIVKGTITVPEDGGSVRNVVVYLEGAIGTPTPQKAVIDQKNLTFVPHVIAVPKGSSVQFLNTDTVMHNVFSSSDAKRFDLGMFGKGESRTVTFDTPGVVVVRCNVHPKMKGYILVLENNYFAIPDERGNYEISGIPPGRYKLRAWHESLPAAETWVNLEEASLRDVDLRLHR